MKLSFLQVLGASTPFPQERVAHDAAIQATRDLREVANTLHRQEDGCETQRQVAVCPSNPTWQLWIGSWGSTGGLGYFGETWC